MLWPKAGETMRQAYFFQKRNGQTKRTGKQQMAQLTREAMFENKVHKTKLPPLLTALTHATFCMSYFDVMLNNIRNIH